MEYSRITFHASRIVLTMGVLGYTAWGQQNPAVIHDIKKPPTGATSYEDQEPVETVDVYLFKERSWQRGWKRLPLNFLDEINIRRPSQPKVHKLIINYTDPRRKQVCLAEGDHVRLVDPETVQVEGGFFGWIVGRIRTTTKYIQAIASGTQYGLEVVGDRARLFVWEGAVEVTNTVGPPKTVTVGEKHLTELLGPGQPSNPRVPSFDEIRNLLLWGIEVDPDIRTRMRDERSQLRLHEDLIRAEFEATARPAEVSPQISLGNLFLFLGKHNQALDVFKQAEQISPRPGEIYNGRGIVFALRPGLGDPAKEFAAAIKRDNRSSFHNNLGIYYLTERKTEQAATEFNTAITLDPSNDTPYNGLGVAFLQSARPGAMLGQAEEALQGSVNIKPRPVSLNNLGTVYLLRGNEQAAREQYERAASLDPNDAAVANNLGVYYLKQARYNQAIDEFAKAIEVNLYDPTAYCNLGLVYLTQERLRDTIRKRVEAIGVSGMTEASSIIPLYLTFLEEVTRIQPEQYEQYCDRFKTALQARR